MKNKRPTPRLVRDLYTHMLEHYGLTAVRKSDSAAMRMLGWVLGAMRIVDREAFKKRFCVLLGRKVYLPFEIGVETKVWPLESQVSACVHECQHVEQKRRDGWRFNSRYLFRRAARASYEAEAYRTNMEIYYWYTKRILNPRLLANLLRNYGCRQRDIRNAEKMLKMAAVAIERGQIGSAATNRALEFFRKSGSGLKGAGAVFLRAEWVGAAR